MVKVVIDGKLGVVQKDGSGVEIKPGLKVGDINIRSFSLSGSAAGKTNVKGGVQTLANHNHQVLSCSAGGLLMVDPGGSARSGIALATGSVGTRVAIANVGATTENLTYTLFSFGQIAADNHVQKPLVDGGGILEAIYIPTNVGDGTAGVTSGWWLLSGSVSESS